MELATSRWSGPSDASRIASACRHTDSTSSYLPCLSCCGAPPHYWLPPASLLSFSVLLFMFPRLLSLCLTLYSHGDTALCCRAVSGSSDHVSSCFSSVSHPNLSLARSLKEQFIPSSTGCGTASFSLLQLLCSPLRW